MLSLYNTQHHLQKYRGADKSLARPGRKQTNASVRMAWISFGALPCRKKKYLMTARVSMLLKSRESLTCFRACFLPGRAKDLSAPGITNKRDNARKKITLRRVRLTILAVLMSVINIMKVCLCVCVRLYHCPTCKSHLFCACTILLPVSCPALQ